MCSTYRGPFQPLRFTNGPLLFEIGLDIGPFYVKGLDIGCKFSSSLV